MEEALGVSFDRLLMMMMMMMRNIRDNNMNTLGNVTYIVTFMALSLRFNYVEGSKLWNKVCWYEMCVSSSVDSCVMKYFFYAINIW